MSDTEVLIVAPLHLEFIKLKIRTKNTTVKLIEIQFILAKEDEVFCSSNM